MIALIDLGDAKVVWALSLWIAAWLAITGGWRPAATWGFCLLCCAGAVAIAKLGFMLCGATVQPRPFSPSGHTAMSAFAYSGLWITLARVVAQRGRLRSALESLGPVTGGAVGLALVLMEHHTAVEVAAGLAWGMGCAGAFAVATRSGAPGAPSAARAATLALPVVALLALAYWDVSGGARTPSEETLRGIARHLAGNGLDAWCP